VGKSFEVADGFLRKIRVAQYQRGLTRVVLEVDPVSEYSAFLLPNPYRLIIDIHGKQPKKLTAKKAEPKQPSEPDDQAPAASEKLEAPDDEAQKAAEGKTEPTEPELKATPQPTSAPTVVAVAPRELPPAAYAGTYRFSPPQRQSDHPARV